MIVITGAAGFIGSCLVAKLNAEGFNDLVLVDDFSNEVKSANLEHKKYSQKVERTEFAHWFQHNQEWIQFVFHLGARTDTTEFNKAIFDELNLEYSKMVWQLCTSQQIPLVYASSAATYGNGEFGYDDNHDLIEKLVPLNPYGESKNEFDKWVLEQEESPFFWAGLKFFNVYGPNEYHKGRMASVIFHSYNQIKTNGKVKLFKSHHPKFKDGEQLRDFIYVKDVVDVIYFLMHHRKDSAIYNLGTGKSRTFIDLVNATFDALWMPPKIEFIDMPSDIREKYQYFTEANMDKLRSIGYSKPFTSLEDGIKDYVTNYLTKSAHY